MPRASRNGRAAPAEALLLWLAAGGAAGLTLGAVLARRNAEGLETTGVLPFVGVSALLCMGIGAVAGIVARVAGAAVPRLREARVHAKLAFPGLAGFAAYAAGREFSLGPLPNALFALTCVLLTRAAIEALLRSRWMAVVCTTLTLLGTTAVAATCVLAWLGACEPCRPSSGEPPPVREGPAFAPRAQLQVRSPVVRGFLETLGFAGALTCAPRPDSVLAGSPRDASAR